jgi:hypothetical protein
MEIGIVIVMLVALIAYGIIASSQGGSAIKGVASTIDELPKQVMLVGVTHWRITILRKSGYIHDVREIFGDANKAITNALTSCRRSGIYSIIITKNEHEILEFYSTNQDGRGKAIGGFRITSTGVSSHNQPVDQNDRPDHKNIIGGNEPSTADRAPASTQLETIAFQLNETKRDLAAMLLENIKPTLNEKQREVLGSLPEDEIIRAMANQITGQEGHSGEPFTFVIPIHFTDSDGTYYENMRLVVTHDSQMGDQDKASADQSAEGVTPRDRPHDDQYDQFGFPEQDAWEGSVYELGGRPQRCDVKLAFRYTDSNGATTNRQIRTKAFVPWLNDDHLVLGFCNYRKANRSFATSQMQDVIDLETGECLDDVDDFLVRNYEVSDYKKIDDFIDERMNVVECLLYLARLDGNLTKTQKTIIYDYIKQASAAAFLTDAIILNLIKDFADDLSPQKFRKLLTQMQREQPEGFAELCDLGEKVVSARRGDAAGGRAALALISGARR